MVFQRALAGAGSPSRMNLSELPDAEAGRRPKTSQTCFRFCHCYKITFAGTCDRFRSPWTGFTGPEGSHPWPSSVRWQDHSRIVLSVENPFQRPPARARDAPSGHGLYTLDQHSKGVEQVSPEESEVLRKCQRKRLDLEPKLWPLRSLPPNK